MFRTIASAFRQISATALRSTPKNALPALLPGPALQCQRFGTLTNPRIPSLPPSRPSKLADFASPALLRHDVVSAPLGGVGSQQRRTVTKFSWRKGKRRTVKAVIDRFYRLNWGGWIRVRAGRLKHLWRKSAARKRRLRQHVFCNSTQSWMLDKMVTKYWRRPKYYVDDPYEQYHTREEFHVTRKKPYGRDD